MLHIRIILCVILMLAGIETVNAQQSAGDKFYNQGLQLQKVMTPKSQRSAIEKFTTAKKFYDSVAKKNQCDAAIATCRNIIKELVKPTTGKNETHTAPPATTLSVSNESLNLEPAEISVDINVSTTEKEWSVATVANADGTSFVSVRKKQDDSGFSIDCEENPTTHRRTQHVNVTAGKLHKSIVIYQKGKPTLLSVEKNIAEFSPKGGSKAIDIYCNSDEKVKENNGQNWRIISKPGWVTVVSEQKKAGGFISKISDKAKDVIKGKNTIQDDASIIISVMKISVLKSKESRSGELIIGSEDQRATILIQQN